MNGGSLLKFGIQEEGDIEFGTGKINAVHKLNHRQIVITSSKRINYVTEGEVSPPALKRLSCSALIQDLFLVIGLTTPESKFIAHQLNANKRNIPITWPKDEQRYIDSSGHNGVFHMFYSPKSKKIITVGSGICVWSVKFIYTSVQQEKEVLSAQFSKYSQFADNYETTILSPPAFDQDNELLYLPSKKGIVKYSLDGTIVGNASTVDASLACYSLNQNTKFMILSDPDNGLSLWQPNGLIERRYHVKGSTTLMLGWINDENVIVVNAVFQLLILNIKTGRAHFCYSLRTRPTRIFVHGELIYVCYSSTVSILRATIPWQSWALNVPETCTMCRGDRLGGAGRILVLTENAFIKVFASRDGELLNTAVPSGIAIPKSVFYSRGCYVESINGSTRVYMTADPGTEEQLLVLLDNRHLYTFATSVRPAVERMRQRLEATSGCFTVYDGRWCYAFAGERGDITIVEQENLELIAKFVLSKRMTRGLYYLHEERVLILIVDDEVILIDAETGSRLDSVRIVDTFVHGFGNGILSLGYPSGLIMNASVSNRHLTLVDEQHTIAHHGAVTSFSFSVDLWASSASDGSICLWDYDCMNIMRVLLPEPICCLCIINGWRDIVVATNTELMLIPHTMLFENDPQEEIPEIDNLDRIHDEQSAEVRNEYITIERSMQSTRLTLAEKEELMKQQIMDEISQKLNESKMMQPEPAVPPPKQLTEKERAAILAEMNNITFKAKVAVAPTPKKEGSSSIVQPPPIPVANPHHQKNKKRAPRRHHFVPSSPNNLEPVVEETQMNSSEAKDLLKSLFSGPKTERKPQPKREENNIRTNTQIETFPWTDDEPSKKKKKTKKKKTEEKKKVLRPKKVDSSVEKPKKESSLKQRKESSLKQRKESSLGKHTSESSLHKRTKQESSLGHTTKKLRPKHPNNITPPKSRAKKSVSKAQKTPKHKASRPKPERTATPPLITKRIEPSVPIPVRPQTPHPRRLKPIVEVKPPYPPFKISIIEFQEMYGMLSPKKNTPKNKGKHLVPKSSQKHLTKTPKSRNPSESTNSSTSSSHYSRESSAYTSRESSVLRSRQSSAYPSRQSREKYSFSSRVGFGPKRSSERRMSIGNLSPSVSQEILPIPPREPSLSPKGNTRNGRRLISVSSSPHFSPLLEEVGEKSHFFPVPITEEGFDEEFKIEAPPEGVMIPLISNDNVQENENKTKIQTENQNQTQTKVKSKPKRKIGNVLLVLGSDGESEPENDEKIAMESAPELERLLYPTEIPSLRLAVDSDSVRITTLESPSLRAKTARTGKHGYVAMMGNQITDEIPGLSVQEVSLKLHPKERVRVRYGKTTVKRVEKSAKPEQKKKKQNPLVDALEMEVMTRLKGVPSFKMTAHDAQSKPRRYSSAARPKPMKKALRAGDYIRVSQMRLVPKH